MSPPAIPDKIKIKFAVQSRDTAAALKALGIQKNKPEPEVREICFYDTEDLDLFESGIILRSRLGASGADFCDITVKVRGTMAPLAQYLFGKKNGGTKYEGDQNMGTSAPAISFSLTHKSADAALVEAVHSGKVPVTDLFKKDDKKIVNKFVKKFKWWGLRRFGPLTAKLWNDFTLPGLKGKVTVELWDADGVPLLEISDKKEPDQVRAFEEVVRKLHRKAVPALRQLDGSKTRFALETLSRKKR